MSNILSKEDQTHGVNVSYHQWLLYSDDALATDMKKIFTQYHQLVRELSELKYMFEKSSQILKLVGIYDETLAQSSGFITSSRFARYKSLKLTDSSEIRPLTQFELKTCNLYVDQIKQVDWPSDKLHLLAVNTKKLAETVTDCEMSNIPAVNQLLDLIKAKKIAQVDIAEFTDEMSKLFGDNHLGSQVDMFC